MKKITFMVLAIIAGITLNAQTIISGSSTPDIVDGSASCGTNSFQDFEAFRSYVLTDFGITDDFQINSIQHGPVLAGAPAAGFPVTITIYTTDAPFPNGTLTELATTTDVLFDADSGIVRDVPISALIPAGEEVVISLLYRSDGITNGAAGTGGVNVNGNASWVRAACLMDPTEIADLADLGLENAWILNAVGEEVLSVDDNILSENVSVFPNPTNGDLNINFARNIGTTNIDIVNVNGQKVLNTSAEGFGNNTLATSKLSNGIYFAQISNETNSTTIKFIKN